MNKKQIEKLEWEETKNNIIELLDRYVDKKLSRQQWELFKEEYFYVVFESNPDENDYYNRTVKTINAMLNEDKIPYVSFCIGIGTDCFWKIEKYPYKEAMKLQKESLKN